MTPTTTPEPVDFRVQVRYVDAGAVVAISGELDIATVHHVDDCVDYLIEQGRCAVELDLADLIFCDNSGITALLTARSRLQARGGSLVVTAALPGMLRLMTMTGTVPVLLGDAHVRVGGDGAHQGDVDGAGDADGEDDRDVERDAYAIA